MAHERIKTKWHRVLEAVARGDVSIDGLMEMRNASGLPWNDLMFNLIPDIQDVQELTEIAHRSTPKIYVDRELIDMLVKDDVRLSIQALHEAGIAKLPYPELVIEFDATMRYGIGKGRNFVFLMERDTPQMPNEEVYHPFQAMLFRYVEHPVIGEKVLVAPQMFWMAVDPEADDQVGGTGFGIHYLTSPAPYIHGADQKMARQLCEFTHNKIVVNMTDALFSALLLLNTRGVHKEVIEPKKLNKARTKAGKPLVPKHTYIRIGHVYDQNNKAVAYDAGDHKRKPMRVHFRRGHTRHVWVGPRKGKQQQKLVYIEPCLVNYVGGPHPVPEAKVTW